MSKNSRHWIVAVCLGLLFFLAAPVYAEDPTPIPSDDEVNAVAGKLFCPVCENIPLDVCGTQACIQWRELIREQLAQGRSSAEIQEYFLERYGEQVLAEPPIRGFIGMIYWLPMVMLLVGTVLLIRTLRTRRVSLVIPAADSVNEIAPYVERLEDELKIYQNK